jgi:hypothetical protein
MWLATSRRCQLFEQIATNTWNRIKRAHKLNSNLKEVGITADIIVDILEYNSTATPNFHVYAQDGSDEKTYGSDLDIYVETDTNQYRWFALQAKLLKKNNEYDAIRDSSNGIMQWLKLRRLERLSGCKGYYLFYNGKDYATVIVHPVRDESQYGCSLVELEDVKRIVGSKVAGKRKKWIYQNPIYEDFHTQYAIPWRHLVCDPHKKNDWTLYTFEQIENASRDYEKLTKERSVEKVDSVKSLETVSSNPIVEACARVGWNPGIRIVVQRSDNVNF